MTRSSSLRLAALSALLLLAAAPALAASFGEVGEGKVRVADMALMEKPSGTFSDKYTVEAKFKGGGDAYFSIHHGSFGVGEAEFEVKSRYTAPDGTKHTTRETLKPGAWTMSAGEALDLQMGRHALTGTPKRWTVVAESEEMRLELTFEPVEPPWRPGSGRVRFGGEGFLDMTVLAPRARVTGKVRLGQEERELTGRGYALHSYSDLAAHELARRMVGFRTESGALSFYLKEIEPSERLGGPPVRWLLVASQGRVLFQSTDFEVTPADIETDTRHPNRYRVPKLLRITGRDGDTEFEAVIKATKLRERSDRLAKLSAVKRAVAARFAEPVYYAYHAAYEAVVRKAGAEDQVFKGRGIYELDHVNK